MTSIISTGTDRIQQLIDKDDIRELIFRYAEVVDTKNWAAWETDVFTDDVVIAMPFATREGSAGLAEWGEAGLGIFAATEHMYGNIQIAVDGDTATTRMNFWSACTTSRGDLSTHFDEGGTYRLQLKRVAGEWRISRLDLDVTWIAGDDVAGIAG